MRAVLPRLQRKRDCFPTFVGLCRRKSRKGKGLNLHSLLANELHSSWKEEDHEIDRRVVSGACKATAIQSPPKKSYHFFHP